MLCDCLGVCFSSTRASKRIVSKEDTKRRARAGSQEGRGQLGKTAEPSHDPLLVLAVTQCWP